MLITCRTCLLEQELPDDAQLLTCPACGTNNARPQAQGDALEKLQRATQLRLNCEFAEAERCYKHVLMDYADEHEALWGLLLCRYGVEFVTDRKTGLRHPIVHIARHKPLQESADFRQACDLAPMEVRAQYQADAEYIDEAQAEIRLLAQKCPPYDVFLCHKTTQLDSQAKTEDYNRAFMLYHKLDKLGYRVFFAPAEMEGVAAGANYEAFIYHALHTAKVMLLVCSDPAYISSTWVQSEWKRYLELVDEHDDRCLLPLLYGDFQPIKLPREIRLRKIEAITMENWDAQENVLKVLDRCCVNKIAPQEKALPTPPPQPPVNPPVPEPASPAANAAFSPENHFKIELISGGCRITGYTGPGGNVEIPPVIGGMPVVEIGSEAFKWRKQLTHVSIPQGVKQIGSWAFFSCSNLTGVSIPDSMQSIGHGAFANCALQKVTLPVSVTALQGNPFSACKALDDVSISVRNPYYYELSNVLVSASGELVCYPAGLPASEYVIPDEVTSIGSGAFYGCENLTDVWLHPGVASIMKNAFTDCASLTLHVRKDSPAHAYAYEHELPFVLIEDETAAGTQEDPLAHLKQFMEQISAPATPAELRIMRSKRHYSALRQIAVRVDEKDVYYVSNGEGLLLKLNPGRHRIDIRLKPFLGGEVNWGAWGGKNDIFTTEMESGYQYSIDLADYLTQLVI